MGAAGSPGWEMVVAPASGAPGVLSMVGYRAGDVSESVHRGLPSPALTFIVSLDDGVEASAAAHELPAVRPNPVVLGGLHTSASHVQQRRGQAGIQMAIHPLAARTLFGVPAAELPLATFDGLAVLGDGARVLSEQLADTADWPTAFTTTADYLVGARGRQPDTAVRPEVLQAWWLLERSRGRIPLGQLADRVQITGRHLSTLFRREVGVTPKTVAMLMRFQNISTAIAAAVRRHGHVDLAAVAYAAGFADQAHLTRDFVRFAGVPPRRWIAEEFRNIQDGGHAEPAQWGDDLFQPHRLADPASA